MSRVAPQAHEPVDATPRKRLTRYQRQLILIRQDNNCAHCGASLIWHLVGDTPVYGPMIDEHLIPLELSGSNDLENRALLCVPCARVKTKADMANIGKSRRLRKKNADPETRALEKPKRPIHNKGFDPSRTRGLNGKVRMK